MTKSRLSSVFSEMTAGGHSRRNGTVEFYGRLNSLLREGMRVLDYGAGRGAIFDDPSAFKRDLANLQNKVDEVVGVDVDPQVMQRRYLDRAHVIDPGARLPFPDDYFDIIYSDWVLEHIADPKHFAGEVERLLKPGGWFCARTPNRWGFTGLATRSVPNRFHLALLRVTGTPKQDRDIFPTRYLLNSRRQLRRHFKTRFWLDCTYIVNADPPYIQSSVFLIRLLLLVWRLTPEFVATDIMVFLQKREIGVGFEDRGSHA